MDRQLAERLNSLTRQNGVLAKKRAAFLLKDAERKHFEAKLIRAAEGRSHAEKTVNAQATNEWREFQVALADLEASFEFEKLKFEILEKAWLAEYATYKIDERVIKKQGA